MRKISLDEAQDIASEYLCKLEKEIGVSLRLVDSETIEKPFGWVFFYNSEEYLRQGNFRDMLTGNAPFIVDVNGGSIHVTGTAKPIDEYIAEYESDRR